MSDNGVGRALLNDAAPAVFPNRMGSQKDYKSVTFLLQTDITLL
jgi:hypothetical protein